LNLVTAFVNATVLSEALAAVLKRRFLIKRHQRDLKAGVTGSSLAKEKAE